MLFLRKSHPGLASLPASAGPAVFRSSQRSFAHAGPYVQSEQFITACIRWQEYKPTSRERELVLAFAVRLSLPAPRGVGSAFSPSRTPMVFCRPLRAGLAG